MWFIFNFKCLITDATLSPLLVASFTTLSTSVHDIWVAIACLIAMIASSTSSWFRVISSAFLVSSTCDFSKFVIRCSWSFLTLSNFLRAAFSYGKSLSNEMWVTNGISTDMKIAYLLYSFQINFLTFHLWEEFVNSFIEIFKFNMRLSFVLFKYHRMKFFVRD